MGCIGAKKRYPCELCGVSMTGMGSDFTVREQTRDDAEGCAKLNVEAWEAAYRGRMPDVILDALDEAAQARRIRERPAPRRPGVVDVVVLDGEEIVGAGAVGPGRDKEFSHLGELAYINTRPAWWGTGAGQLLHDELCRKLSEFGHTQAYLWVLVDNPRAHRFYQRNGWLLTEHTREETRWGPPVPEVQYQRTLTAL